ncbi:helix-turn-helix protein [Gimesia fumaroli]|uniref:Helix-turn-helix protein n=2 Tax=Gimesia fumaroli TaxID=2527976 RepID=A0A518I966_9PLAN|nr:helix-turn-helix protein [Gimesia fumaroli]
MQDEVRKAVRDLRKRFGFKQYEFAAALGVSNVHLCNVERGYTKPSLDLLAKMREEFNGIDVYVYAWCQSGDVAKLPSGVQKAAKLLTEGWQKRIDQILEDVA